MLSRNKVAVPEGAAGTPPFWSNPHPCRHKPQWESKDRRTADRPCGRMGKLTDPEAGYNETTQGLRPPGRRLHHSSALLIGGLAQLARAPALQAGGQRFESVILHSQE